MYTVYTLLNKCNGYEYTGGKTKFVLLADMCGIGLMLCRVGRGGRGAVGQKGQLKQPHLTPLATVKKNRLHVDRVEGSRKLIITET